MSSASVDVQHTEEPPPQKSLSPSDLAGDVLSVPDELVCEVCLGIVNEPKKLGCAHSFCRACLHRLLARRSMKRQSTSSFTSSDSGGAQNGANAASTEEKADGEDVAPSLAERRDVELKCPTCEQTTVVPSGDVDQLSTSVALSTLLSDGGEWSDALREDFRQKIRLSRTFSFANKASSNVELSLCSEHQSVQEFYCIQCKVLACGHCMLSLHKDHIHLVKSAREAEDQMLAGLRSLMQPSQEAVFAAGEVNGLIGELKKDVVKESTITTNRIKQFFNQARELLQERESELIWRVDNTSMRVISDLTKKDELLRRNLSLLSRYIEQVRSTLQQPGDVALLSDTHGLIATVEHIYKQITSISTEITRTHKEQTPSMSFEGTTADFSQLGRLTEDGELSDEGGYVLIRGTGSKRSSTSGLPIVYEEGGSAGLPTSPPPSEDPIYEEPTTLATFSRRGPGLPPRVLLSRRAGGSIRRSVKVTLKQVISCNTQTSNMRPCGICVGETDAVIVSDIHSHCVKVLSHRGRVMDTIVGPQSPEQILGPVCLATDKENQLYILDKEGRKALYRFKNGKFDSAFSSRVQKSQKLNQSWGMAVSDEFIYVTDWHKSCIHKFDTHGKHKDTLHCGQQATAVLRHPVGIAIMPDGSLMVADQQGHCLWRVVHTKDVVEFQQIGSESILHSPYGVAVTKEGLIVVTDTGNSSVCLFSSSGTFLTHIGKSGTEQGEFQTPRHVCITEAGEILVADEGNQRIQVFEISN